MAESEEKSTSVSGVFGNYDDDMFQRRLAEIKAMPEGEEKKQALLDLTQDYEGLSEIYSQDILEASKNMDQKPLTGTQVGDIYVAPNALQGLASVLRQGVGGYQRGQARDAMMELSNARTRGNKGIAAANSRGDGGQQPPEPQQTQAQMPDLGQYGVQLGQNPQGAGMGQVTPRGGQQQPPPQQQQPPQQSPQQIQNAVERRQNVSEQGGTPPPMGQGVVGQTKLAAGLRGMGKPDLESRGIDVGNAGMGQQTGRPQQQPQKQYTPSRGAQPYNPRGAAMAQGMTEQMNPNLSEEERKRLLMGLMNRNSGGY